MSWDYIVTLFVPLIQGAGMTLAVFAVTFILSLPLGFCVTLQLNSRHSFTHWFAETYVYILRGTPLLLQLWLLYCKRPV